MDIVTLALAKKYARQVGSTIESITATDTGIHFVTSTGEFDVNLEGWTGTEDYLKLINKPLINDVELVGNKTLNELGISKVGETGNYNDLNNKPNIPTKTSELTNDKGFITSNEIPRIPTKTSELTNDSDFITNAVDNLINYYKKTETFTQQEIQDLIRTVSGLQMQVVDQLPVESIDTNTIYLLKVEGTNSYEQWIYSNNQWFKLGTTDVSLVDYYTKTQIDEKFVQKEIGKTLSSNDFTNEEKNKLNQLSPYSIKEINKDNSNKIWVGTKAEYDILTEIEKSNNNVTFYITDDVVQEGGVEIQELQTNVDRNTTNIQQLENTKANVSDIPTKTSQLENDSNYAVKSEIPTQTSQLNNDSGFITSVNIPTKTSELTNDSGFISKIPQATTELGGIRANPKQDSDTTEVRIDSNTGYLYCSGGGSSGAGDDKQDKPTNTNTSYGVGSLINITTGTSNTAIGNLALNKISDKSNNTAVGNKALENCIFHDNTAIGAWSLNKCTTGQHNSGIGENSLYGIETGSQNTGLGFSSLTTLQDGKLATGIRNCTGVGANTSVSGDNQVQLGNSETTTYCYGAIQNRSDRRDKTDIQETTLGLTFINSLRPVEFKWDYRDDYFKDELQKDGTVKRVLIPKDGSKKRNRPHQGFIAQEVKQLADELNIDFGGYQDHSINGGCDVLSLGYEEFIAPMVKAIQEQQQMIEELKTELQILKNNK